MPSPKPKKKALGRGLGSLIQEAQSETGGSVATADSMVDIESIHPNPNQPRTHFNDAELNELSDSIAEHGVLQQGKTPVDYKHIRDNYTRHVIV